MSLGFKSLNKSSVRVKGSHKNIAVNTKGRHWTRY